VPLINRTNTAITRDHTSGAKQQRGSLAK